MVPGFASGPAIPVRQAGKSIMFGIPDLNAHSTSFHSSEGNFDSTDCVWDDLEISVFTSAKTFKPWS